MAELSFDLPQQNTPTAPEPVNATSWAQSQWEDTKSRGEIQSHDDELAYAILFGTDLSALGKDGAAEVAARFGDKSIQDFVTAQQNLGKDIYVKEFDSKGNPIFDVNEAGELTHYVYDNGAYRSAGAGWNDAPYYGKQGENKSLRTKQGNYLSYNPNDDSHSRAIESWKSTPDYQQRVANQEILSRYAVGEEGLAAGPVENRDYFLNDDEVMQVFGVDAAKMRGEAALIDKFGTGEINALDLLRGGVIDEKTFQENFADRITENGVNRPLTSDEVKKSLDDARLAYIAKQQKDDPNYGKVAIPDEDLPKTVQDVMNIPILGQVLRATSEFYTIEGKPTMSLLGGLHSLERDENGDPVLRTDIGKAVNPLTHIMNAWNIFNGATFDVLADYVVNPMIGATFEKQWLDKADPEFVAKWNEALYPGASGDFADIAAGAERWQYIARNVKEQMAKGGASGLEVEALSLALLVTLTSWTPGGVAKNVGLGVQATRDAIVTIGKAKSAIKTTQDIILHYNGIKAGMNLQRDHLVNVIKTLERNKGARSKAVLEVNKTNLAKLDAQLGRFNEFTTNLAKGIERNEKVITDTTAKLGKSAAREMFLQAHRDVFETGLKLDKAIKNLNKTRNAKNLKEFNKAQLEAEMALQRREYVNMGTSGATELGKLVSFSKFLSEKFPKGFKDTKGDWKKAGAAYLTMAKQLAATSIADAFQYKTPFVLDDAGYVTNVVSNGFKGSTHIYNVLENPTKFKFKDGELAGKAVADHNEIKMIRSLYNDRLSMLKEAGIDIKELSLEADQMWAARRAIKQTGRSGGVLGKKTQEFEREFPTVDVGIANGTKYEANYRQVIGKTMDDAYAMVAEKQIAEYIKKYGADLLPNAKSLTAKGAAALLTKLNGITDIATNKQFLSTVSQKLKDAVTRNAADDEIRTLMKEAIESVESVTDKGALVSFKGVRGVEGMKFLAKDAENFNAAIRATMPLGGVKGAILNTLQSITSLTRFTITAFDLGAGWIHGFPLLWNNPKIWGESWGRMLRAMHSKEWMYGYVSANKAVINDAIIRGHMVFESAEYMEGLGLLSKIPGIGRLSRGFERAFTGFLDTSRIEMYKALSKPGMDDAYARSIGSHIDRLMGSAHYTNLGADKNWAALQSVILFAPRYYRSCLGLYKNIATGDIRGFQALQSVAKMQASMHLSYYAMCKVLNQEAYLDPSDSRYLSFKVGNSYIGFGGFHRSLNRLLVDVGNDLLKGNMGGVVETIAEFGRAKLSTLMRLPVDIITGTNFLGENIFDDGVLMAAVNIGKGQLPIFAQALLDGAPGDEIGDRVTRMGFEFLGLRSSGFNEYRQLQDKRDTISKERYNVDYKTLEKRDPAAARSLDDIPEIIALRDAVEKANLDRGSGWWGLGKQYNEYKPVYSDIQDKWRVEVNTLCEDLRKGLIDEKTFRDRVYTQNQIRSAAIQSLNAKYPDIANRRYDPKDIPDDASKQYAAYYAYLDQVLGNEKLDDPNLDVAQYSTLKKDLDAQFVKTWGQDLYDYVQQARLAGRGQHPIYNNFKLDKDEIAKSGYWDINPMTDEGKTARQMFRQQNPYIDALLFRWGYTQTLQTPDAEAMAKNLLRDIGITKTVPEAVATTQMKATSQTAWEYINKNKSSMSKVRRGNEVNRMSDTAWQIQNRIQSLEKQIDNALTLDKKIELVGELQTERQKLDQVNQLVNSYNGSEPYLNYLKAQLAAWTADSNLKWGYVSRFK